MLKRKSFKGTILRENIGKGGSIGAIGNREAAALYKAVRKRSGKDLPLYDVMSQWLRGDFSGLDKWLYDDSRHGNKIEFFAFGRMRWAEFSVGGIGENVSLIYWVDYLLNPDMLVDRCIVKWTGEVRSKEPEGSRIEEFITLISRELKRTNNRTIDQR